MHVRRVVLSVAVGATLASAAMMAYVDSASIAQWKAAAFFSAFGVLASVLMYQTSSATSGSIGFLPFLSIAIISPNIAALSTVFLSILAAELVSKRAPIKAVFNIAQYVFAEAMAIASYRALGGAALVEGSPPLVAFVALVVVFLALNKLAVSTVVSASSGASTGRHWVRSMRLSLPYDMLAFPLIMFFAVAYTKLGAQWSAALALPMLGMRQMYKTNVALQKINEELLQLMVAAIEARDPYTSGHSQRVARYARIVATAAGLGSRSADRVVTAALLHDVGKIHEEFAPILRKPGRLTDAEFTIMKSHSAKSSALVSKVSHFADLVPMIHSHHEAWDGSGYPDGVAGEGVPVGARVIALADTIDAMSTSRPYRAALSTADVFAELSREAGRQFDPAICRVLLSAPVWREMEREIVLATAEFPVHQDLVDMSRLPASA